MILVTKHNVTTELLESICSNEGDPFLLLTPVGIRKFRLCDTTNSRGTHRHEAGMLIMHGQGPYLVFNDDRDTILHGDVTELVSYIKNGNYTVVPSEACDG